MTAAQRTERAPAPFGFKFVAPLALGSTLNPINSTMLTTALVPIGESLHAGPVETGWLIAALYLTTAIGQPTMGRLVDLFGPRRIYLISLFFVAAAGVFGGLATSLTNLVMVRVILGIGTSGAYPSAMRIFRERADLIGSQPPRVALGILSLAAISTTAVGPLIGGLLTSGFGWHSIFWVNVPLAMLTVVLILLWVPKDRPREGSFARLVEEVDLAGVGLFAAFLLSLMIFMMNPRHPVWTALAGAVLFGAVLCFHSLRRDEPFIDVRMLVRNRGLSLTYVRACAVQMIVYCVFYGFAQWLESAIGYSSAKAGIVTLPMSIVAAVSSVTGVRTRGLRWPFIVSVGAALGGCMCLLLVDSATSVWIIAVSVILFGIPQGTFLTATQAAVYVQAPPEKIGAAAGLQRTAQYIGAIAAASFLALNYGERATDMGFHGLATGMGVLSAVIFVAVLFDRTIPGEAALAVPKSGGEPAISPIERKAHAAFKAR